eukprot:TRINITY_DN11013_c0_g1_i1.p1 TRINITY_DN11013_c0_g1~~TRINITY_DN11013_c0_g1_i1.p1  ORF type:complete len:288 (-),score=54.62 TRINITY_DN11013_c0_g1_i1:236-973(-)
MASSGAAGTVLSPVAAVRTSAGHAATAAQTPAECSAGGQEGQQGSGGNGSANGSANGSGNGRGSGSGNGSGDASGSGGTGPSTITNPLSGNGSASGGVPISRQAVEPNGNLNSNSNALCEPACLLAKAEHRHLVGPVVMNSMGSCGVETGFSSEGGVAGVPGSGSGSGSGGSGDVDMNGAATALLDGPHGRSARREAALNKFRQKRKERCFEKKVRYQNRKRLAEQRPRVRGQFVRQGPSAGPAE